METITFKEVKLLMRRKNAGKDVDFSKFWDGEVRLTDPEQGISYLLDQWKTPNGKERKNNPFGYREQHVLENFSHFEFKGGYDMGNRHFDYHVPLWVVVAKDGSSFEYYMKGGEVNIVG